MHRSQIIITFRLRSGLSFVFATIEIDVQEYHSYYCRGVVRSAFAAKFSAFVESCDVMYLISTDLKESRRVGLKLFVYIK